MFLRPRFGVHRLKTLVTPRHTLRRMHPGSREQLECAMQACSRHAMPRLGLGFARNHHRDTSCSVGWFWDDQLRTQLCLTQRVRGGPWLLRTCSRCSRLRWSACGRGCVAQPRGHVDGFLLHDFWRPRRRSTLGRLAAATDVEASIPESHTPPRALTSR